MLHHVKSHQHPKDPKFLSRMKQVFLFHQGEDLPLERDGERKKSFSKRKGAFFKGGDTNLRRFFKGGDMNLSKQKLFFFKK